MKKLNLQIVRCVVSAVIIFAAVVIFSSAANAQQSKEDFFNGAIAAVTKEIAAKPKDDKLYVKRGEYYLNLKYDYKEAIADADRALKINPKTPVPSNFAPPLRKPKKITMSCLTTWEILPLTL